MFSEDRIIKKYCNRVGYSEDETKMFFKAKKEADLLMDYSKPLC